MADRRNAEGACAGRGEARRGDAGNALVVALLVLMVLTSAGVAYVAITKSEKQIARNQMSSAQALYAAESGITEGLHRMAFPAESTVYIGPPGFPVPGWGRYIVIAAGASALDPDGPALESDGMDNDGDATVDEAGERYPEVMTKQTINANALRYPFVRVEFKTQGGQLVRFGDHDYDPATAPTENMVNGAPELRITAAGNRGTAAKRLEVEAVRFPLVSVGGTVWSGGKTKINGNAFLVDGYDHQAVAPYDTIAGAPEVPAILTEGPTTDIDIAMNQQDNVTGEGGENSIQQSTFTYDFNMMWNQIKGMADYKFSGGTTFGNATPAYGTLNNPKIVAVDGNLDCQGTWSGAGILIVNGNLSMGGGSSYKGIVIALGDAKIAGGGPADLARIVGALIYQGTLVDDSSVGGSATLHFSSAAINAALTLNRYTLSWWRER